MPSRSRRSLVTDNNKSKTVRHLSAVRRGDSDDDLNRPLCGLRGDYSPITPKSEPLFDLCTRCIRALELVNHPQPEPVNDRTHGTRSCYLGGCRRPECIEANRTYQYDYMIRFRQGKAGSARQA